MKVTIIAGNAALGFAAYQLALQVDTQTVIVPMTTLSIGKATTYWSELLPDERRWAARYSRLEESATALGMPLVTSYYPSGSGLHGQEIVFNGRDFAPAQFRARIGTANLTITSKTANEIRATLPANPITGPLIVGYGTTATEYPLENNYVVYGDPTIAGVTPASFGRGDTVTIQGTDLFGVFPLTIGTPSYTYIKISNTSANTTGNDFVRVSDWSAKSDGTEIMFFALEAYSNAGVSAPAKLVPQPTNMSGKLRLLKAGAGTMTIASPTAVTFTGTPALQVTSIDPPTWGGSSVDFIIVVPGSMTNPVEIRGRGMFLYDPGTTARIGTLNLTATFDTRGVMGRAYIPYEAYTNPIALTRSDGQTANTPSLKVIPSPHWTPTAWNSLGNDPLKIKVNTTYQLQGWYLQPTGIPGLTYSLELSGLPNPACMVLLNVVQHTPNLLEFRVDSTGSIPAVCDSTTLFGATPGTHYVFRLLAKFGTGEKELVRKPYYLQR